MPPHARTPRRIVLGAGVAAVALLLAACGGSAEDAATEDPAVTASPALQATPTPEADESPAEQTETPAPTDTEPTDTTTVQVVIEGDSISPNTAELSLPVGGGLTLRITSDRAGEFHVHARPESYVQFTPGETTETLTFENPGTVEIEEHDTGFAIAVVEVR